MPDAQPSGADAPAPPERTENQGFLAKHGGSILRMLVMWAIFRFIMGNGSTPAQKPTPIPDASMSVTDASMPTVTLANFAPSVPEGVFYYPQPVVPAEALPNSFVPLWQAGTLMDLSVYVSEDEYFVNYRADPAWRANSIMYGHVQRREQRVELPVTSTLQQNATLYAHIFLARKDSPIDPGSPSFVPNDVVYYRHPLTKFYPKKSQAKQKKLLDQTHDDEDTMDEKDDTTFTGFLGNLTRRAPLVSYWHENVTISIVDEVKELPKGNLQPPVIKYIPFDTGLMRDETRKAGFYRPIVFPNDFWLLRQNAYSINETVSVLPLTIHLEPMTLWKFNIYATLDESMKQQSNSPMGGMSSSEMDEAKRMFLETNPVLLGTTLAVSLLHSLFEMLAFKNDITFWKKKDNSVGVSVRSILVNIFFQIVIFLYLMDNNQETSWMILIGQGVGLLIEIWKVFKALKYEFAWTPGSLLPRLRSQPTESSKEEDDTAKYDAIAFKYLTWLSYPLLAGYAVYSLLYDEHKSWYSYVLKTLVEFVYMFGFITMLPQLYINYRLKSVAHMPWKTLMYKSLNTFIDDLFAFVIKMPTLHRLACLRDDVVFFVYLYQRYAYKVDPTRANEYGQVAQPSDEAKTEESKKDK